METSVKQRLIEFIKYKGLSQKKFEQAVGLGNGYVNNIRKSITEETVQRIVRRFPELNKMWLIFGDGTMLGTLEETEANQISDVRHVRVPLVHQYAYGGFLSGYGDPEYLETLPTVDFTPDREMTGIWLAFEVRGDSMDDGSYDAYRPGNIVICREVEPDNWKLSRIHYNKRDFVIVHEEGILLKRITSHDVENHVITVHSLNPEYPDRQIDLAQVRRLFSIVESRRNRSR